MAFHDTSLLKPSVVIAVGTYDYDHENRLITFNAPTSYIFGYAYRTRRVEATAPGQSPTRFIFSGGTSVQERHATTGALIVENIRGSDWGGGVGGLLYTLRDGIPSYNHYNSRGDVTAKTNDTNNITFVAQYEAFGNIVTQTGSSADRQRSNTKDWDIPGYANEGFRFRDLETGTFLTRDPLGFIDGPNMYAYVVQNPWTKFDPEGLNTKQDIIDSGVKDMTEYYQGGSRWQYAKGLAKVAFAETWDVFSLGTLSKNSAIEDDIVSGKMSVGAGITQMAGNGAVATGSVVLGGGATGVVGKMGGGAVAQGAAFGFTQSTSQVVGERGFAAATGGTYEGTLGGDLAKVGITTGGGAAIGYVAPKVTALVSRLKGAANVAPEVSAATTPVQMEFSFARGASVQTPTATQAGEIFVRVGATKASTSVRAGSYAMPQTTFNTLGRNPSVLKNALDLPGSPPQYFRYIRPPAGTPVQRGIVPGGEYGGVGGYPEVIFPKGVQ